MTSASDPKGAVGARTGERVSAQCLEFVTELCYVSRVLGVLKNIPVATIPVDEKAHFLVLYGLDYIGRCGQIASSGFRLRAKDYQLVRDCSAIWKSKIVGEALFGCVNRTIYDRCAGRRASAVFKLNRELPEDDLHCFGISNVALHFYITQEGYEGSLYGLKRLAVYFVGIEQGAPLHASEKRISQQKKDAANLKNDFPAWRFILLALIGIFCTSWGWWNLRNAMRLKLGTVSFVSGLVLWLCGFGGVALWWVGEI